MIQSDNWFETIRTAAELGFLQHAASSADRSTGLAAAEQQHREIILRSVALVEEVLDGKRQQRNMSYLPGLCGFPRGPSVRFAGKDLRYLERVAARLWTAHGTGRADVEEALLGYIALAADPGSLPFYRAALAASRPRDQFQPKRRRMVLAAIAYLAQDKSCPDAAAELQRYLDHADPAVRGDAVECFARIHLSSKGRLAAAAVRTLSRIAIEDPAFIPRFMARIWLTRTGHKVPLDHPDGAYDFRVTLGRASYTIELAATQSLARLACAILSAFGWDGDHLYEFALTGDLRDRRFVLPTADEEYLPPDLSGAAGTSATSSVDLPVGSLGLTQEHRFVFRYDFGADHRFDVLVAMIHPRKERRAKYPRVVAGTGKPPEQYPRWE